MKTAEIKKLITEKNAWNEFRVAVCNENDYGDALKELTGLNYEFVERERENGNYFWRFKLDGLLYEIIGSYYSQEGADIEYGYRDFYRVEPKQVTVTHYEMVKDD